MSVRLTPERVRRKLVLVVGRSISRTMRIHGAPLAGWAPLRRDSGQVLWLKCYGRPGLRYTEPAAYRHAVNALTPSESREVRDDFFSRSV